MISRAGRHYSRHNRALPHGSPSFEAVKEWPEVEALIPVSKIGGLYCHAPFN